MYPTTAIASTVKVRLVKGSIIVAGRVHPAGVVVEVDEMVAVHLVDEGGATFAPGTTLSGDARALQAELAKLKGKPAPPRPDAPSVRIRVGELAAPNETHLPPKMRSKPTIVAGSRVLVSGEEAEVREDDAARAIAASSFAIALSPGSAFSPRGERYYDKLAAGRHAAY